LRIRKKEAASILAASNKIQKRGRWLEPTMSSSVGGTLFGPGFESKLLFLEQFRKYTTTASTSTGKNLV
jgi:hypothetical protein